VNTLDLNNPPPDHDLSVTLDRAETSGERKVRLFKDVVLFLVSLCFVILIAWLCVRALLSATSSPEEKKWAMSILSASAGGLVGYMVKR
jgi:hypothetical protein